MPVALVRLRVAVTEPSFRPLSLTFKKVKGAPAPFLFDFHFQQLTIGLQADEYGLLLDKKCPIWQDEGCPSPALPLRH
jgi:hypothetical protein